MWNNSNNRKGYYCCGILKNFRFLSTCLHFFKFVLHVYLGGCVHSSSNYVYLFSIMCCVLSATQLSSGWFVIGWCAAVIFFPLLTSDCKDWLACCCMGFFPQHLYCKGWLTLVPHYLTHKPWNNHHTNTSRTALKWVKSTRPRGLSPMWLPSLVCPIVCFIWWWLSDRMHTSVKKTPGLCLSTLYVVQFYSGSC